MKQIKKLLSIIMIISIVFSNSSLYAQAQMPSSAILKNSKLINTFYIGNSKYKLYNTTNNLKNIPKNTNFYVDAKNNIVTDKSTIQKLETVYCVSSSVFSSNVDNLLQDSKGVKKNMDIGFKLEKYALPGIENVIKLGIVGPKQLLNMLEGFNKDKLKTISDPKNYILLYAYSDLNSSIYQFEHAKKLLAYKSKLNNYEYCKSILDSFDKGLELYAASASVMLNKCKEWESLYDKRWQYLKNFAKDTIIENISTIGKIFKVDKTTVDAVSKAINTHKTAEDIKKIIENSKLVKEYNTIKNNNKTIYYKAILSKSNNTYTISKYISVYK